ncbi:hypothetical protein AB3Y40_09915 [Yoonia sp. R2331]|uniref:hypothetical protein n=1 Tax=Yoonia sp. R2331 TaxID=3237238 RepID=UPI0034E57254
MIFRFAAIATAIVCAVLFVTFLLFPGSYAGTYSVPTNASAEFITRRSSGVFLGLAVMLWMGRNAPDSPLRRAVCYGLFAIFAGIAATGCYEYARGFASVSILVAALGELVLAGLFLRAARP